MTATGLDVVLAGVLDGSWQATERALAQQVQLPDDATAAGVVAFRRSRKLISAADFQTWLTDRGLTLSDIQSYVSRSPHDLYVEAVCSGTLGRCARTLADGMVAARALGDAAPAGEVPATVLDWYDETPLRTDLARDAMLASARRVSGFAAAKAVLGDRVATGAALEECLTEHRQAWELIEGEALLFATVGEAREAGMLLSEGADPAGHARERRPLRMYVGDTSEAAQAALLRSGLRGDAVAVWPDQGGWTALQIIARTQPELTDDGVLRLARTSLLDTEIDKLGAGRVTFHAAY